MSSTDNTESSGAATRLRRHSSSFLEKLKAVGSRSPRSSQDTLPPPSPGLPSASNIYGSTVQYRLPHLLTTRPPVSRIATTEYPVRKCLIDYGPVLECYSNLSTPPIELSVRVVDDNTRNFVGAERPDFEEDVKAMQITLDERFEALRKQYTGLDEYLCQSGHRDKQALLHQAIWQADLENWLCDLPRPPDEPEDSEWRQFQSIWIAQMPHRKTFSTIVGNSILNGVQYEAPQRPADVIHEYQALMAAETGTSYPSSKWTGVGKRNRHLGRNPA